NGISTSFRFGLRRREAIMKLAITLLMSASLVPDLALAQSIQTSSQPGQEAVAQGVDLDQVFIRIKQEVGYFESTNPKTPKDWDALLKRLKLIDAVTGKPLKSDR